MLHWFLDKKKKKKKSSKMDKEKDKDRSTGKETKQNTSLGRGSAHRDQSTGNFTVDIMMRCINEIVQVEAEAAAKQQATKIITKQDSSKTVPFPSPQTRSSLCRICGYLLSWGFVIWLAGAVPSSLPPSSAAFPSTSPHLSTETRGKSFRSIFKQNRCYNTSRLDLESTLPPLCLV